MSAALPIAKADAELAILPRMANRHGLVAGATGTGKTVTLRVMAEQFSLAGIPVFMADVKGDLSGLARAGGDAAKVAERVAELAPPGFGYRAFPVVFWDLYGKAGHPVRATVSDMGPLLFARLLGLNDTQAGVLTMVFRIADDNGLLLLDLKDLRAMLQHVGEHAADYKTRYGNVSPASVGAIQRGLLELENQGAEAFFGEPALALSDLMRCDADGRGTVNILVADKLIHAPKLYATFLLWLLAELFETLPEVGDPDKPRLAFFFDEAHLLFDDAPAALLDKIEQVVRLVRSKGVGVYFVTQNPVDIPETVLGQLGNRVQHALRAFTPRDQKAVRAAAQTFRSNPALDVEAVITELGVGEALVSLLDDKGRPGVVERAFVYPPQSRLAPLDDAERAELVRASPLAGRYEAALDRDSAYEMLERRAGEATLPPTEDGGRTERASTRQSDSLIEAFGKSLLRAAGSTIGRQLIRGVLGSLLSGDSKRRR
ncbi:helicase HerA-like domain-containing protein [Crenobacter luteus]|uniref:ATP-binding protein n=1 Tax=Crenobacter luteus TaxID=1452487 RepID=A0A161SF17_9NEIS|nr:helicase HerA-like domain-containing protein [Crenobacter luteus]KZE35183.1 ATP-binding protein [Crenobacter luteus]